MGLLPNIFSSSPAAAEDKRATEVRTGAVAPTRAERAQCWAARDTYFACLDAHGIVDALDDADGRKKAAAACRAESAGFEKDCAAQWVRDFLTSLFSLLLSFPPTPLSWWSYRWGWEEEGVGWLLARARWVG
jgi:cytochrome c oxidase assembly factor 6